MKIRGGVKVLLLILLPAVGWLGWVIGPRMIGRVYDGGTDRGFSTDPWLRPLLDSLGREALSSGDVPVGSVVLYRGKVLGTGWNTVERDGAAAGHAEVNALSSAMAATGYRTFAGLDRDSLELITTFEPCRFCLAVISAYGIRNVRYGTSKPLLDWFVDELRWRRAELSLRSIDLHGLQDTLFRQHPAYRDN